MTPEVKARIEIDTRLAQADWLVQNMKQLNLGALEVAVREYPTDSGLEDYVLFLNRDAIGVIEAKRNEAGENIIAVESLAKPPLMLTTERLWSAYPCVKASQIKGANTRRQLTDLVSLVRFAIGLDTELTPFSEAVDRRFQAWIFRHNAQRATAFTPEQTEWLRLMKDHIASSCSIARDDFDYAEFASRGGLQKAWTVLGKELDKLMTEMNEELVA